jgi:hypothetical protein
VNLNFKNPIIIGMGFILICVVQTVFCVGISEKNQICTEAYHSETLELKEKRAVENSMAARACGIITAAAVMSYFLGYEKTFGIRPIRYFFNRDCALLDFFIAGCLVAKVFRAGAWGFAYAYFPITEFFRQLINNSKDDYSNSSLTASKFLEETLKHWPKVKKFVNPDQYEKFDVLYQEYLNNGCTLELTDDEINQLFFSDEQVAFDSVVG